MKTVLVGMGLSAMLAVPNVASAQAQAEPKFFLRPTVGAVVGAGPGASFSASLSLKAGEKMQITAEFGRLTNILPDSVLEQVEINAALVANVLGGKHSATASAAAGFGMVGVRHALRDVSGAHTYVEVGVGMARVTSKVSAAIRGSAQLQGDISSSVTTPFTLSTPDTKPMAAIGGGIILPVNRMLAVEMGVRYIRLFTDATAINMSNISGSLRFGF